MRYNKNSLSILPKILLLILVIIFAVAIFIFFPFENKFLKEKEIKVNLDFDNIQTTTSFARTAVIKQYTPTFDERYIEYQAMQDAYENPPEPSHLVPVFTKNKVNWVDPTRPVIALTFDDGPSGESSDMIYDTLEQYDARATFFLLGLSLERDFAHDKIQRMVDLECQIANHTYHHYQLGKKPTELIHQEEQIVIDMLNQSPSDESRYVVRVPYGIVSKNIKETISAPIIHWNRDSVDWNSETTEQMIANLGEVKDGDILLFHDIHMRSAEAMKVIIPDLQEKGFQFLTIDEMFQYKKIPLVNGEVYYSAN